MESKPFVLCVAAWRCGGKTTIVNELYKRLSNAKIIYFDKYPIDFLKRDYYQWSINGNDYNEWHFEPIAQDIDNLLQESIDYILFEFPVGYANDLIAQYIDYTVFIDVPVDVLLARQVIRDYCRRGPDRKKLDNPLESLSENLTDYLTHFRVTVFNYIEAVKPSADFIVDGYQSIDKITNEIINELKIINPREKN